MRNDLLVLAPAVVAVTVFGACLGNEPQLDPKFLSGPGGSGPGGSGATAGMGGAAGDGGAAGAGGDVAVCGDGVKAAAEACDDDGTAPGDGCDDSCEIEIGWGCTGTMPSVCSAICGDDMVVDGECEDGNRDNGDGCRSDCTVEACGDGIVDANMLCFVLPTSYPSLPGIPTIADLNADGAPDLVLTGDGNVGVRLNVPATPGTFGAPTNLGPGLGVRVLDVNGDTDVDIVVAANSEVFTLPGNGDGTFDAALAPAFTGITGMLIDVAPLDGDAFPDVAAAGCNDASGCANGISNHVIRLNFDNGTFPDPASQVIAGRTSFTTRIVDVNNDGMNDLVTLNQGGGGSVGVYLGNGNGTFQATIESVITDNCYLNHLDLGLVNADAFLDVVVGNQCLGKPIQVLFGTGTGSFGSALMLATATFNTFTTQFADVDNDGHLDVLSGTQNSAILFYKGDGAGAFGAKVDLFTTVLGDLHLATGDLNGDGALDVVATHPLVGINVYLSNP